MFLIKFYQRILYKYPTTVQALQAGMLMGTGDVIAQTIIEKRTRKNFNYVRTLQFFGMGTVLVGPTLATWYKFLSKQFGDGGKMVTFKKVACDQLIFAPCFIGIFLSTLSVVQGKTMKETENEVKKHYFDVLKTNYKIWPWVQLGNFYVVPLHYQVVVVQIVALFWNAYLSWKTQKEFS